eukprot:Em0003g409a
MSCEVDGVEVTCPPRVCPNSRVVFTCTVKAASSSFWKLPANTCPSYNPRDTINLAQTAGLCGGTTNQCGPFAALNLASDIPGNATMTTTVSDTTVSMIWTPPTMGGVPTSYNISINGSNPIAIPANGSEGPLMYTYTRLESDMLYAISLVAINCAGISNVTTAMIRTSEFNAKSGV